MTRLAPFLAAIALVLLFARPAFAVGGVLVTPGETGRVIEVRYALALSAAQTTRWASLRFDRFPTAAAWILPVRPGARIDEVGDAWFEALELATAPRVVAPPCGDGGASPPKIAIERRPSRGSGVPPLRTALLDDVPALRAFAQSWGLELTPEMEGRLGEVTERGFALLALVYSGPPSATATRTVRITDDAFPWVPLLLTVAGDDPIEVKTFVLAETRTRLGPGPELEIDGARISMTKDGATNYAAELRSALLGARGASFVAEAAGHDLLFEGARGPANLEPSPALAPAYFRLAGGDDHNDASDLALALSGLDLSAVWLTRMSGIVPPRAFGDDLAVTRRDAQRLSPFLVASGAPPSCPTPDGGRVGPGGGPGGTVGPPYPPPSSPPLPPPTYPPRDLPPPTSVGMSCSCAPGSAPPEPTSGDESCDGSDPGAADEPDEGCDGSADDSSGDSCDGSADDSYDGSDDGCDGSSSSGSGSEGGCSSGAPESGDGCSSDSTGRSEGCSTAPSARSSTRARRAKGNRTRISVMTVALAAVGLVLRRATKRRCSTRQRRASTGARIGFGQ
ncbi:MAG TPA: DUF2330 domain-containing protein [Polyangiaceae bacterium]|nr:DUF2330 domain-containing protein [Polyangiaceae bacterium]